METPTFDDWPNRLLRYESYYAVRLGQGRKQSDAHFDALQFAGLTEAGLVNARHYAERAEPLDAHTIRVGSIVAYAVNTLRGPLDPYAHQRGVVVDVRECGQQTIYKVCWPQSVDDGTPVINWVIAQNLALVGPNAKFCKI